LKFHLKKIRDFRHGTKIFFRGTTQISYKLSQKNNGLKAGYAYFPKSSAFDSEGNFSF